MENKSCQPSQYGAGHSYSFIFKPEVNNLETAHVLSISLSLWTIPQSLYIHKLQYFLHTRFFLPIQDSGPAFRNLKTARCCVVNKPHKFCLCDVVKFVLPVSSWCRRCSVGCVSAFQFNSCYEVIIQKITNCTNIRLLRTSASIRATTEGSGHTLRVQPKRMSECYDHYTSGNPNSINTGY
jgi:hypothetical protein